MLNELIQIYSAHVVLGPNGIPLSDMASMTGQFFLIPEYTYVTSDGKTIENMITHLITVQLLSASFKQFYTNGSITCNTHACGIKLTHASGVYNDGGHVPVYCVLFDGLLDTECSRCLTLGILCMLIVFKGYNHGMEQLPFTDASHIIENLGAALAMQHNINRCASGGLNLISEVSNVVIFDHAYSIKMLSLMMYRMYSIPIYYTTKNNGTRCLVLDFSAYASNVIPELIRRFILVHFSLLFSMGVVSFSLVVPIELMHIVNDHSVNIMYRSWHCNGKDISFFSPASSFIRTLTMAISNRHNIFDLAISPAAKPISKELSHHIRMSVATSLLAVINADVEHKYMPTKSDSRFRFIWRHDISTVEKRSAMSVIDNTLTIGRTKFFNDSLKQYNFSSLPQQADNPEYVYLYGICAFNLTGRDFRILVFTGSKINIKKNISLDKKIDS